MNETSHWRPIILIQNNERKHPRTSQPQKRYGAGAIPLPKGAPQSFFPGKSGPPKTEPTTWMSRWKLGSKVIGSVGDFTYQYTNHL